MMDGCRQPSDLETRNMESAAPWKKFVPKGIARRLSGLLNAGLTPERLAATIVIGVAIGVMPLVGGASLLCALFAIFFRLNHAGIQAANFLAYPLQIALFIPFYRMGERIFPGGVSFFPGISARGDHAWLPGSLASAGIVTVKAMAVWSLVAPPVALLLYLPLAAVLRRRSNAA